MKKVNLKDHSLSHFEIDTLFTQILNNDQIKYISRLLEILGTYIFLDRTLLDQICIKRFGEKIGLSYLQKSIDFKLINEYKFKNDIEEKDIYYFSLKKSSSYFLESTSKQYFQLPLNFAEKEKSRILTYNYFLVENNLIPYSQKHRINTKLFLSNKENSEKIVACYFPNLIDENEVYQLLEPYVPQAKEGEIQKTVYDIFDFKEINKDLIEVGNKTKANLQSMLD